MKGIDRYQLKEENVNFSRSTLEAGCEILLKKFGNGSKFTSELIEELAETITVIYLILRCYRGLIVRSNNKKEDFLLVREYSKKIIYLLIEIIHNPTTVLIHNFSDLINNYYIELRESGHIPFTHKGGGNFAHYFLTIMRAYEFGNYKGIISQLLRASIYEIYNKRDRDQELARLKLIIETLAVKRIVFVGPFASGWSELIPLQIIFQNSKKELLSSADINPNIDVVFEPLVFMPNYQNSQELLDVGIEGLKSGDLVIVVDDSLGKGRIDQLRNAVPEGVMVYENKLLN